MIMLQCQQTFAILHRQLVSMFDEISNRITKISSEFGGNDIRISSCPYSTDGVIHGTPSANASVKYMPPITWTGIVVISNTLNSHIEGYGRVL